MRTREEGDGEAPGGGGWLRDRRWRDARPRRWHNGGHGAAVAQTWPRHSNAGGTAVMMAMAQRWRWPSRAGCPVEQSLSLAHPGHNSSAPGGKCLGTGTDNGGGDGPAGRREARGRHSWIPVTSERKSPRVSKPALEPGQDAPSPRKQLTAWLPGVTRSALGAAGEPGWPGAWDRAPPLAPSGSAGSTPGHPCCRCRGAAVGGRTHRWCHGHPSRAWRRGCCSPAFGGMRRTESHRRDPCPPASHPPPWQRGRPALARPPGERPRRERSRGAG